MATLSVASLQSLGVLPPGWVFDPNNRYRDIYAGIRNGAIGIGVVGSESGVKPLIESYGADARAVYFPFPRTWGSHGFFDNFLEPEIFSSTTGETLQMLMMTFDAARLQEIAARLAERAQVSPGAPPPEASR